MSSLNYHHLYYFFTIAKAGSITKACEILHLSQPALSAQLKTFESILKRRLFDRHKKRLLLTEDGRMVLDYAERIFDMGQQLEDTLRDRAPGGRLGVQVGVMSGTPRLFTESLYAAILNNAPTAHVIIEERPLPQLVEKLVGLNLDVLLTDTPVSDRKGIDCTNTPVGRVPVVFAGARTSVQKYGGSQTAFDIPIILPAAPDLIYQQVKDLLSAGKLRARVVAEVQDSAIAARLACRGVGLAPVSSYLLTQKPFARSLKPVELNGAGGLHENFYLVTRNRQWPNPLVTALLKGFRIKKF